jgi:hypothetical protein
LDQALEGVGASVPTDPHHSMKKPDITPLLRQNMFDTLKETPELAHHSDEKLWEFVDDLFALAGRHADAMRHKREMREAEESAPDML